MNISYCIEILQPPHRVFPWIAEPEKALHWQRDVKAVKILEEQPGKSVTKFTELVEEGENA
jgi:hypothetical protein